MGQVCHRSAATTHAVRATLQRSQASLALLSKKLGVTRLYCTNQLTGRRSLIPDRPALRPS